MILENGLVRTLDDALPVARALAIAGDRVAGGVGTHEVALPTPEVVDLGGRCVVPGFTDSHVHFPTWSLGQRDLALDGVGSLADALERVRGATPRAGWIRGLGWRSAGWEAEPTKEALDEVTGETPAALWAKDLHSLWLNSAALALAEGDLEVEGGVVERDENGEPTGVLREESAWHFRDALSLGPRGRVGRGHAEPASGSRTRAASPRSTTRTAGSARPGSSSDCRSTAGSRSASGSRLPWRKLPHLESLGDPLADRRRLPPARLPEGLHGRDARLADGVDARRLRRADHERRGARRDRPGRGARRLAGRRPRDRRPREPGGARRVRGHARRVGAARAPAADRARAVPCIPTISPASPTLGVACSVQFSHAPSDRDLAERFWPDLLEGAYAFRSLLESGAVVANGSDAPIEELDPLAGIRAGVTRTIDDRPGWRMQEALTRRAGAARDDGRRRPGSRATSGRAGSSSPATSPTSSSSRATSSSARRTSSSRSRSSRPWSAAAGCTTLRPGTEWSASSGRKGGGCSAPTRPPTTRRVRGTPSRSTSTRRERCGLARGDERARDRAGDGTGDSPPSRARARPARRDRAGPGARRAISASASATGSRSARPRSRTPSSSERLRPRGRRVVVPLGRRGGRPRADPRARSGRAAGSRSGGRLSATRAARTRSRGRDRRARRRPAAKPDRRVEGRPAVRARRREPASPRSSGPASARSCRTRIAVVRIRGTPRASAGSSGASRRSHALERRAPESAPRRDRARSRTATSAAASTKPLVTALYTARKPS